jgi:hypothetical protein
MSNDVMINDVMINDGIVSIVDRAVVVVCLNVDIINMLEL